MSSLLNKVNKYIKENCLCDGLGPMDSFSDTGNFEDMDEKQLIGLINIIISEEELKKFHVKYYYLATGMEGVPDKKDYGIVEARTPKEAIDIVLDKEYGKGYNMDSELYRYWGMSAREVGNESNSYIG